MITILPVHFVSFVAFAIFDAEAAAALPARLTMLDEIWVIRDTPGKSDEQRRILDGALAEAPRDFEVLWRAARYYFWASDDGALSNDRRSTLGKTGWDLAEGAVVARPGDVRGHYYAAVSMGSYALGLGVVKALSMGMEGKFRDRLGRAAAIDRGFDHGGIDVAWGRFFQKLPWPKRDLGKAEQHFRKAIAANPNNLRSRVFFAEAIYDEGRAAEAKQLLDQVRQAQPGKYDPPEERRAKAMVPWLLAKVMEKLK